jgi:hypothetical protein
MDELTTNVALYTRLAWLLLALAGAVGFASMAVVQVLKEYFPLRRLFHRWWVERALHREVWDAKHGPWSRSFAGRMGLWEERAKSYYLLRFFLYLFFRLKHRIFGRTSPHRRPREIVDRWQKIFDACRMAQRDRAFTEETRQPSTDTARVYKEARDSLVLLASAGDAHALYSLPAAQLAGLVNSAAQIVVDNPKQNQVLLWIMAKGANPEDVDRVLQLETPMPTPPPEWIEARSRIIHQIQRNLDALQIGLTANWKFFLQLIAAGLSGVALFVILNRALRVFGAAELAWYSVLLGMLGGYLATVARDLLAVVQQLRVPSR